jgi:environmental stress-induced protein Ves
VSELTVGLLPRDEQGTTPWLDGGGVTRELAAGVVDDELAWRVSIARIDEPGAFSRWPGMHRSFTLLAGDEVVLTIGGNEHAVLRGQTLEFSGDAAVECSLPAGPVEALNLMTHRGQPLLELHSHHLRDGAVDVVADDLAVLVEGEARVHLATDAARVALAMGTLDALLPTRGPARVVEGVGELLVIHRP